MKITREKNNLVLRLPLEQDAYDAASEVVGRVPNLIGVIFGNEQGIYQSVDMTYKGKEPQVGGLLVQTYYSREEFIDKCKEWGVDFFEYPICGFCDKPIFGTFTLKDQMKVCYDCGQKMGIL